MCNRKKKQQYIDSNGCHSNGDEMNLDKVLQI